MAETCAAEKAGSSWEYAAGTTAWTAAGVNVWSDPTSYDGHARGLVCCRSCPAGTSGPCTGCKDPSVALFTNPWAGEPIAVTTGGGSSAAIRGPMG